MPCQPSFGSDARDGGFRSSTPDANRSGGRTDTLWTPQVRCPTPSGPGGVVSAHPGRFPGLLVRMVLLFVVLVPACSRSTTEPDAASSGDGPVVTVGSFDFAESRLLGELYAQALERQGIRVTRQLGLGARELVQPALAQGLVDLVPEYSGSARRFLATTRERAPSRSANDLASLLKERGLVPLAPSTAQNANAIVVTDGTARRLSLRTVSDLAPVASSLRFGAPAECPERPYCLPGLSARYGLSFGEFVPMADFAITIVALTGGEIDVGLLGTTDPSLADGGLVMLEDDRRLQPDELVVPIVRREVLDEVGPRLADAVATVSARLSTAELVRLNRHMVVDRRSAEDVAGDWLDQGP